MAQRWLRLPARFAAAGSLFRIRGTDSTSAGTRSPAAPFTRTPVVTFRSPGGAASSQGFPGPATSEAAFNLASGQQTMKVGKYKGKTFTEIYAQDPQYCRTGEKTTDSLKIFAAFVQHRWLLAIRDLFRESRPNSLRSHRFAVTGQPDDMSRELLESFIRVLGGEARQPPKHSEAECFSLFSVAPSSKPPATGVVVAGSTLYGGKPVQQSSKLEKAAAGGIPVLTLEDLRNLAIQAPEDVFIESVGLVFDFLDDTWSLQRASMQGSEESSSSDADSVENFDRSSKPLRQPAVARLQSHSSDSDSSAEVQRAIDEDSSESSSDSISQANSRARTAQSPPVSKASSPARTAQSPSSPHVEVEKRSDHDKETDGPAPTPPEQASGWSQRAASVMLPASGAPTVDVTQGHAQREEVPQVAGVRDAVPDVAEAKGSLLSRQREQRLQTRRLEAALWNSLCMEDKDKLQNMLQVIEDSKSQLRRSSAEEVDLQSVLDNKAATVQAAWLKKHVRILTSIAASRSASASWLGAAFELAHHAGSELSDFLLPAELMRIYDILEGKGPYGSTYSFLLTVVILVNIASFMLSTEPSMAEHQPLFDRIEMVTVCIFTFEYVLRFSTRAGSCLARITWVFTDFFSIVDLVSIMPFYVDILIPGRQNYLATQWVRVVRLLRLLPALPYDVIWKKSYKLLMASGFAGCTVWVICAALYYWFEKDNADMIYCPDEDGKKEGLCWNRFHSIPAAMYYSLLNFFGEFPLADKHSLGGRFVGGFIQVMGAAVMAIPAGALGNAFSEVDASGVVDADDVVADASRKAEVVRCLDGEREVRTYRIADVTIDMADLWFSLLAFLVTTSSAHFILGTVHNLPVKLDELFFLLYAFDVLATLIFCVGSSTSSGHLLVLKTAVLDMAMAVDGSGIPRAAAAQDLLGQGTFSVLAERFRPCRWLECGATSCQLCLSPPSERYIGAFGTFKSILYQSRSVLFVTGGAAAVLWVIFSTLMYYAERYNPDPDMAGHYSSVATSMWVTLLNLSGEAPLCEYTPVGKFISALMGLIGVGFVTIPMGLLGSGFQDYLEQEDGHTSFSRQVELFELCEDDDDAVAKPGQAKPESEQSEHSFRQLVYKFLQGSASNQVEDLNAWEARAVYFERCIFLAIFVTVLAAIMELLLYGETVHGFAPSGSLNRDALNFVEITATLLFTVEYGLRYYTAPEVPYWAEQGYVSDNAARFGFVTSLPALIDLTAIAPYYLALCGSSVADRYDGELRTPAEHRPSLIGRVFRKHAKDTPLHWPELPEEFQLAAYAAAAIWLIFSALMWLTERHDPTQVDDLTMAQRYGSMPEAMPYTLVHLTGDYPLIDYDFPAKCVLFVALLFAVGVVAVPTGLLASGFAQDNLALEPYAGTCSGLQQSRNRPSTFQELTKYREEQRRLREEAATKIEKALRQYIRRRRLRQAQKTVLCELKDKAFKENCLFQMHMGCTVRMILPTAPMLKRALSKDNPYKLHMVKFLEQKTTAGRLCKKAMFLLIILNVLAVIAESMSWVKEAAGSYVLNGFELFSVLVFTFEYSANVWSAPANSRPKFQSTEHAAAGAPSRNYICSFFGIVDLVTVAPFWIQTVMWLSGLQFNAFIFRIARLLRILQLEDFVESFTLLDDAWRSCRETMVATGFMALLVWICGAVLFYEFEQAHSSLNRRFKERVWNEGQSCNGWCLQGHCGSPGLPSLTSKVFREEQVAFNAAVTAIEGSSVQHVFHHHLLGRGMGDDRFYIRWKDCLFSVLCCWYRATWQLYGIPIGAVFEAFSDVLADKEDEQEELSQFLPSDVNQDPACQDLRRRLEKAEQEARLARERELRSIDQITRWDSSVELLRLSLDNVKAELKRLEHEAQPGRSWLHSLRERQMASSVSAASRALTGRVSECRVRLRLVTDEVAELKASQVQEIADLRSSQAEELLKLEVGWTTQAMPSGLQTCWHKTRSRYSCMFGPSCEIVTANLSMLHKSDDFFDLLPIEYPFQAPQVGIDPVAGRLLAACGSVQNLAALAIAASQLHSFNVRPDGSYDLTVPQFALELESAEVSELLGTCRQLFEGYAQLAALDFEAKLWCTGGNCAAHPVAVLRKSTDLCQTPCRGHHDGMNRLTISDVAERSAARMCSIVASFCRSLQESQAGVSGIAGFAMQAAAEIRIFLDHAFHVLSFLPTGLLGLQPFSELLEHGSPAFRHVPVAGLRWDVLLHILASFGTAERSRGLRVAEIGVEKGMTVTFLLKHEPAIVDYYLVDPWHVPGKSQESNDVLQSYYENLEAWSSQEPAFQRNGRKAAHILRQSSEEAAGQLGTDYFDLVFIDAEHTFEAVRRDIQVWKRRVRPGGILAGHDFSLFHPAVSLAVLVECGPLSDDTGRFPLQSELEKPIIHLSADSVWWVRRA
eukprot:s2154_g7.t2